MKHKFQCEQCEMMFDTYTECLGHEKQCKPRTIEDRMAEIERKLNELEGRPSIIIEKQPYYPHIPLDPHLPPPWPTTTWIITTANANGPDAVSPIGGYCGM